MEGVTCQLRTEFLDSLVPGPDRYPAQEIERSARSANPRSSSPSENFVGFVDELDRAIAY